MVRDARKKYTDIAQLLVHQAVLSKYLMILVTEDDLVEGDRTCGGVRAWR
jgi:hypothetical protein